VILQPARQMTVERVGKFIECVVLLKEVALPFFNFLFECENGLQLIARIA
jgi:hypothetical protein